jgi:AraC-like DNA-binding protein
VVRAVYQGFHTMKPWVRGQVWSFHPNLLRPRHFHYEPELNLLYAGEGTFGIGESVIRARAGDLLSFAPGQDHVVLDASHDLAFYSIGIRIELPATLEGGGFDDGALLPCRTHLSPRQVEDLCALAAPICERVASDAQILELWLRAMAARHGAVAASPALHVLTCRALRALTLHPELDRKALAQLGRTGPTEIGRHFRRDVGLTLVRYRTRVRLLHFIHRMDLGATELMSAAMDAGFGSYSQLCRIFRANVGASPRTFFAGARRELEEVFEPAPR